jgi:hypothetical protein
MVVAAPRITVFSTRFGDDPRQNLIVEKITPSAVIKEFRIYCPLVTAPARAGQFVIVCGDDRGEWILFTIADSDRRQGILMLMLQVVGLASHKLDELDAGDKIKDIVTGAATVIEAMGAGKKAAAAIDRRLKARSGSG